MSLIKILTSETKKPKNDRKVANNVSDAKRKKMSATRAAIIFIMSKNRYKSRPKS